MKIPLEGDERVVVRTRRHPRALRAPTWVFFVLMFLTGAVLGLLSRVPALGGVWDGVTPYLVLLTWILAAIAALAWVLVPVLRWLRSRVVITTRRLMVYVGRHAVGQLPLAAVADVRAKPALGGGRQGPGTLEVRGGTGRVVVNHCPDVQRAAAVIREQQARLPAPMPWEAYGPGTTTA